MTDPQDMDRATLEREVERLRWARNDRANHIVWLTKQMDDKDATVATLRGEVAAEREVRQIVARVSDQQDTTIATLRASLMEMRRACAACFRVIAVAKLDGELEVALRIAGVGDGFGIRAGEALAEAPQ